MEKEKALYISSNLFPVNSGAAIYSYGNIMRFSNYFDIDLLSFVQSDNVVEEQYYNQLKDKLHYFYGIRFNSGYFELIRYFLNHKVLFQKYSIELVSKVKKLIKENDYQYIFLDGFLVFYLIREIQKIQYNGQIVLIAQNIEYVNFYEQIQFSKTNFQKFKNYLVSFGVKRFELRTLCLADFVLYISENDRLQITKELGRNLKSEILPPYFPFTRIKELRDLEFNSHKLLILGSMWWYPNIQGTQWFIEQVYFSLKNQDPRYMLYVVGKDPAREILKYASDDIIFAANVQCVDEYIRLCDFLVVPNFSGGGVKIKIYEGIMKGIPVLARPESLTGYPDGIFPKEYVPGDSKAFINTITEQNNNYYKKMQFIENARKKLMDNENIDAIISLIQKRSI